MNEVKLSIHYILSASSDITCLDNYEIMNGHRGHSPFTPFEKTLVSLIKHKPQYVRKVSNWYCGISTLSFKILYRVMYISAVMAASNSEVY